MSIIDIIVVSVIDFSDEFTTSIRHSAHDKEQKVSLLNIPAKSIFLQNIFYYSIKIHCISNSSFSLIYGRN
jgi:hypothetical protein